MRFFVLLKKSFFVCFACSDLYLRREQLKPYISAKISRDLMLFSKSYDKVKFAFDYLLKMYVVCYVMLCYVMSCYVMLCYVMSLV